MDTDMNTVNWRTSIGKQGVSQEKKTLGMITAGRGVLALQLLRQTEFAWEFYAAEDPEQGLRIEVARCRASIFVMHNGDWQQVAVGEKGSGLDSNPDCQYWISIDPDSRRLKYGKGAVDSRSVVLNSTLEDKWPQDAVWGWLSRVSEAQLMPPLVAEYDVRSVPVTDMRALVRNEFLPEPETGGRRVLMVAG